MKEITIYDSKITCSPTVSFKGRDVFLVNLSVRINGVSKFLGIQFPERYVSYCEGYTKEEVEELLSFLSEREDELKEISLVSPPLPSNYPREMLEEVFK